MYINSHLITDTPWYLYYNVFVGLSNFPKNRKLKGVIGYFLCKSYPYYMC